MPPQGDQCPFCQLIDNPEQLLVVEETENFYAWLEINPRAKGHTQVVPKEHKESITDFSPEEYDEAMKLVRKVIEKAEEGLGADGASVTMNIGEAAGQMLPHAYISVFPRFEEDERAGTPTGAIFPQRDDLQQDLKEMQESMSSVAVDFEEERHEPHRESQRFREPRKELEDEGENKEEKKEDENEDQEDEEQREKEERVNDENDREKKNEGESSEPEQESEGEGHWDGKSFEWR